MRGRAPGPPDRTAGTPDRKAPGPPNRKPRKIRTAGPSAVSAASFDGPSRTQFETDSRTVSVSTMQTNCTSGNPWQNGKENLRHRKQLSNCAGRAGSSQNSNTLLRQGHSSKNEWDYLSLQSSTKLEYMFLSEGHSKTCFLSLQCKRNCKIRNHWFEKKKWSTKKIQLFGKGQGLILTYFYEPLLWNFTAFMHERTLWGSKICLEFGGKEGVQNAILLASFKSLLFETGTVWRKPQQHFLPQRDTCTMRNLALLNDIQVPPA